MSTKLRKNICACARLLGSAIIVYILTVYYCSILLGICHQVTGKREEKLAQRMRHTSSNTVSRQLTKLLIIITERSPTTYKRYYLYHQHVINNSRNWRKGKSEYKGQYVSKCTVSMLMNSSNVHILTCTKAMHSLQDFLGPYSGKIWRA